MRGHQVAPIELEGVLLGHPNIVDAAVVGVPSSDGQDEVPRAYVVLAPGSHGNVDEKLVKEHMSKRLARYKNCDGGVVFVPNIPKTASGKILKRVLREQAVREMKAEMRPRL